MKNKQELTKAEVAVPVLSPHGHQTQQCTSSHCHSTTAIQPSYTVSLFSLSSDIFFLTVYKTMKRSKATNMFPP